MTLALGVVTGLVFPAYEFGALSVVIHLIVLPIWVLWILYRDSPPINNHLGRVAVALLSMALFFLIRGHVYSWTAYGNHRGHWGIDGESQAISEATFVLQAGLIFFVALAVYVVDWRGKKANLGSTQGASKCDVCSS